MDDFRWCSYKGPEAHRKRVHELLCWADLRWQLVRLQIWVPNQVYSYFTESFRLLPPVDACHQPPIVRLPRRQGMGLWTLLEGCLLLANALAILNEDRFLAPRGWSFQEYSGVRRNSFKGQLLGLIYATQYLRVLLILLNTLCIVVKFVSG